MFRGFSRRDIIHNGVNGLKAEVGNERFEAVELAVVDDPCKTISCERAITKGECGSVLVVICC